MDRGGVYRGGFVIENIKLTTNPEVEVLRGSMSKTVYLYMGILGVLGGGLGFSKTRKLPIPADSIEVSKDEFQQVSCLDKDWVTAIVKMNSGLKYVGILEVKSGNSFVLYVTVPYTGSA